MKAPCHQVLVLYHSLSSVSLSVAISVASVCLSVLSDCGKLLCYTDSNDVDQTPKPGEGSKSCQRKWKTHQNPTEYDALYTVLKWVHDRWNILHPDDQLSMFLGHVIPIFFNDQAFNFISRINHICYNYFLYTLEMWTRRCRRSYRPHIASGQMQQRCRNSWTLLPSRSLPRPLPRPLMVLMQSRRRQLQLLLPCRTMIRMSTQREGKKCWNVYLFIRSVRTNYLDLQSESIER